MQKEKEKRYISLMPYAFIIITIIIIIIIIVSCQSQIASSSWIKYV